MFTAFLPAISKDALRKLSRTVRGWRLHRCSDLSFAELPVINLIDRYYGAFYPVCALHSPGAHQHLPDALDPKKYKRLRAPQKGPERPRTASPRSIPGTSPTGPGSRIR